MVYVSFLPPWTNFIDRRESFCCVNNQVNTLMKIDKSEVFQHPKPEVNWLKWTRKSVWPSSAVTDQIWDPGCYVAPIGRWAIMNGAYPFHWPKISLAKVFPLYSDTWWWHLKSSRKNTLVIMHDVISTYLLKNILFWECENKEAIFWREENCVACFLNVRENRLQNTFEVLKTIRVPMYQSRHYLDDFDKLELLLSKGQMSDFTQDELRELVC